MLKKTCFETTFNNMQKRKLVASHGGVKRARACLERRNAKPLFLRGGELSVAYRLEDDDDPVKVTDVSDTLTNFVRFVSKHTQREGGGEGGGGEGGGRGAGEGEAKQSDCNSYAQFRDVWGLPTWVSSCYNINVENDVVKVGPYLEQTHAQFVGQTVEIPDDVKAELKTFFTDTVYKNTLKYVHVLMNVFHDNHETEYLSQFLPNMHKACDARDAATLGTSTDEMTPCVQDTTHISKVDLHITSAFMSQLFSDNSDFQDIINAVTQREQTLVLCKVFCEIRYTETDLVAESLETLYLTPDISTLGTEDVKQFKFCDAGFDLKDVKWWNGVFFSDLVKQDIKIQGDKQLGGSENTIADLKKRLEKLAMCWGICIFWIYPGSGSESKYIYDVLNNKAFTMCILYTHRGHYSVGESRWVVFNVVPFYSENTPTQHCDDHTLIQVRDEFLFKVVDVGGGAHAFTCNEKKYHFDKFDFQGALPETTVLRTALQNLYHRDFNSFESIQTIYATISANGEEGEGGGGGGGGGGGPGGGSM